jgi:hypothetical protein
MMAGITGIVVRNVGKELTMSNDSFSFHVNEWILKKRELLKTRDELEVYNYLCEDCNSAFVTDIPWMHKCDDCHHNYFEDSNE